MANCDPNGWLTSEMASSTVIAPSALLSFILPLAFHRTSIGKDAWENPQALVKRVCLNGYDLWPMDSLARGKEKEILITGLHTPILMNLLSDRSREAGMGNVLRPSPLTFVDMGNTLETLRAGIKNITRLKVSDTIKSRVDRRWQNWRAVIQESGVSHGEKTTLQHFDFVVSFATEESVRRAVNALKVLLGSRTFRTYLSLFKYTEVKGSRLRSRGFWSKKVALEQADIEEHLLSWVGVIKV